MDTLQRVGPLAGRLLIAAIFIFSGLHKLTDFGNTAEMIGGKGVPLPELATMLTILIELGGGLMLAVGWKARYAAVALALFTLAAGLMFHNFWAYPAAEVQNQMAHFMKNIAIIGGLMFVALHGSGAYSLDRYTGHERRARAQRHLAMDSG